MTLTSHARPAGCCSPGSALAGLLASWLHFQAGPLSRWERGQCQPKAHLTSQDPQRREKTSFLSCQESHSTQALLSSRVTSPELEQAPGKRNRALSSPGLGLTFPTWLTGDEWRASPLTRRRTPHKLKKTSSLWKARVETRCLKKFTISDFIQITIQYRAVLYNKVFNFIFSVEEKWATSSQHPQAIRVKAVKVFYSLSSSVDVHHSGNSRPVLVPAESQRSSVCTAFTENGEMLDFFQFLYNLVL